ncbi:MAG: enoyl-CoA hydratase/isomerase family protein [Acetobacteraceae bacterium]|nr:enoyl-CoA hydratase/isomerase family protein [Acetobacteraceae bacterium]
MSGAALGGEHVRAGRAGGVGRLTLNRPAALNALTLDMIRDLAAALDLWEGDPGVHLVLIEGAGSRAFCAGGDIRAVYDSAAEGSDRAHIFWAEEYRLDARIAQFSKPVVVFMTGIVMGGGVGVSAHARHRVVTETTRLAMPEVGIGLIPDVGGTWLLSRAPGETGTYLALTGTQIGAADIIALGMADSYVAGAKLGALAQALEQDSPRDHQGTETAIGQCAETAGEPSLGPHRALIDRAFAHDTVEAILRALDQDGSAFARRTAEQIATKSPTSLKLALRALREARSLASLQDCLRLEYRLMTRILPRHDLREGIRAAVIDKDRNPKWQPASLAEIRPEALDPYFASLGPEDLQF